jgi:hypothetical protein
MIVKKPDVEILADLQVLNPSKYEKIVFGMLPVYVYCICMDVWICTFRTLEWFDRFYSY